LFDFLLYVGTIECNNDIIYFFIIGLEFDNNNCLVNVYHRHTKFNKN